MSFRYYYRDPDGDIVEIVNRVQLGGTTNAGTDGLVMNAEEGSYGTSTITIDDPTGDFLVNGLRVFYVKETECAGDDYDGRVYQGYTWVQTYSRDREFVGDARTIEVQLTDINTVFERRVMVGSDCNRPAETDVARITWLMSTNEASLIDDTTYFSTDSPFNMDAADYRGQSFRNIFDDCSQQSGKNWYLWESGTEYSLWYGPRGTTDFASSIKISNDPNEIDVDDTGVGTVFPPAATTKLTRDPSRVYSGVWANYASSHLYTQRESTAVAFARRDAVSSWPNVKTKTQAKVRSNRYLNDISTEEDVISTAIVVVRSQANDVVAGQRIQVQFTHFDGYHDYVWCRVLNRTIRELTPTEVELAMELSPDEPVNAPSSTVFGVLQRCVAYDVLPYCYFARVGDNPTAGDLTLPTVGLITPIQDPDNPYFPNYYTGWLIGGDGTVDVKFYTSTIGITPTSVFFAITLNGIPVVSLDRPNLGSLGNDVLPDPLVVTGLAVTTGDIIRALCVATPQGVPFFRSPRGTGNGEEALTITGGSLV